MLHNKERGDRGQGFIGLENVYEDIELVIRYRLDHEGIMLVGNMVRDAIAPKTNRSKATSVEMKVATTLRYLAARKNAALH